MAKINKYLQAALAVRASDIHFCSGEVVRARVDGDLTNLDFPVLDTKELTEILFEILTDSERQKFSTHKNLDKSYAFEELGFFRVNIFNTRKGISAVLRAIPQKIPTPGDLGLPQPVVDLTGLGKGLVLVTGPTGSGKSTTLAALIGHINATCPYHILTAEDPVEFVHESRMSLINQREIGSSCPTFTDALKYALREDPDVILVGEMRDLETIGLALTAAETGHLVFGTLHTRGAAASVDRIIDSFPADQQAMIRTMLAESLVAVISQSLLKRCDRAGRVAAYEIMVVNHAISNLIREGKTFQITSQIQTGRATGMVLMDQYIHSLVMKGIVAKEEAAGYMEDPSILGKPSNDSQAAGSSSSANAHPGHAAPKPSSAPPAKPPTAPGKAPAAAPPAFAAAKAPAPVPAVPTAMKPPTPAPVAAKTPAPAPAPVAPPTPAAPPKAAPPKAAPAPKSAMPPPPALSSTGVPKPPVAAPAQPVNSSGPFKPLVTDLTDSGVETDGDSEVAIVSAVSADDEEPQESSVPMVDPDDLPEGGTSEMVFEAVEETQMEEFPVPKKKTG